MTTPDGTVVKARDLSGQPGWLFRRNSLTGALEAVRRWRFKPATQGGQPVVADVIVPLDFAPQR